MAAQEPSSGVATAESAQAETQRPKKTYSVVVTVAVNALVVVAYIFSVVGIGITARALVEGVYVEGMEGSSEVLLAVPLALYSVIILFLDVDVAVRVYKRIKNLGAKGDNTGLHPAVHTGFWLGIGLVFAGLVTVYAVIASDAYAREQEADDGVFEVYRGGVDGGGGDDAIMTQFAMSIVLFVISAAQFAASFVNRKAYKAVRAGNSIAASSSSSSSGGRTHDNVEAGVGVETRTTTTTTAVAAAAGTAAAADAVAAADAAAAAAKCRRLQQREERQWRVTKVRLNAMVVVLGIAGIALGLNLARLRDSAWNVGTTVAGCAAALLIPVVWAAIELLCTITTAPRRDDSGDDDVPAIETVSPGFRAVMWMCSWASSLVVSGVLTVVALIRSARCKDPVFMSVIPDGYAVRSAGANSSSGSSSSSIHYRNDGDREYENERMSCRDDSLTAIITAAAILAWLVCLVTMIQAVAAFHDTYQRCATSQSCARATPRSKVSESRPEE